MKRLILMIIDFLKSLFGSEHIEYFDLLDEYEDYVRGQDISIRNVLIGVVRSVRQYDVNFEGQFYHIPEGYVVRPEEIEYVALYRSANLFGKENSGVVHYGKVSSFELTDRCNITELPSDSVDKYYRFQICEWFALKSIVKPREYWPHVCSTTNKFLLETSRYYNQLMLTTNEEFKLYYGLCDLVHGVYDGFYIENTKVRIKGSKIVVSSSNCKKRIKISSFNSSPVNTAKTIYRFIYGDYEQL